MTQSIEGRLQMKSLGRTTPASTTSTAKGICTLPAGSRNIWWETTQS
ncbi:MAG: hypothetical protein IH867_10205 [Chloroflexi bacterium]|nr:hypothetical protein [Chloroflexota bacterium]